MKPTDENEAYTGKMPASAVRVVVDLSYDSPSSHGVKRGLHLDELSWLELHYDTFTIASGCVTYSRPLKKARLITS
jgi:hypothetical protein